MEILLQNIGTLAIFFLAISGLFVLLPNHNFLLYGRTYIVWLIIYLIFASTVRSFVTLGVLSQLEARIINGLGAIIPLLGVIFHMTICKHKKNPET